MQHHKTFVAWIACLIADLDSIWSCRATVILQSAHYHAWLLAGACDNLDVVQFFSVWFHIWLIVFSQPAYWCCTADVSFRESVVQLLPKKMSRSCTGWVTMTQSTTAECCESGSVGRSEALVWNVQHPIVVIVSVMTYPVRILKNDIRFSHIEQCKGLSCSLCPKLYSWHWCQARNCSQMK